VDLEGDLAAILAIATNKKPARESPDGLAQVELVVYARGIPVILDWLRGLDCNENRQSGTPISRGDS